MIMEPNDEQKRIIEYAGNIVVTANPGSGKTYTIVEKIAKVLPALLDFQGIIAISFTNKASDELKKRCKSRCSDTKQSFFGTIDKFYISQIIIPFACHITGSKTEYKVINSVEENSRYARLLNHKGGLTTSDYPQLVDGLREGMIFLKYTGETALYILENIPGPILYLKARYSHIIIDEYQDCGEIQDKIFTKLVENGLTGIAVGDINQAIYGFTNRFPRYLISLIRRKEFKHFKLSENHRCHPAISEYSLCLYDASKIVPTVKRVFKVDILGNERNIANSIDNHIAKIKEKYKVVKNNKIAILCRSNNTITKMYESLHTPCKVFGETELDKDNSEWGRIFRDLISSSFDDNVFVIDYVEQIFSKEYEPRKYFLALSLCKNIFSCSFQNFSNMEENIISFAELVYPNARSETAIKNLKSVIYDSKMLSNYVPARENEINLMTLHKSKGLEFNIVFHMDMYRWILPNEYGNTETKQQDLNLHYVGITRAIDVCYIMIGTKRYCAKQNDYISAEPSAFLSLPGLADRRSDTIWQRDVEGAY